ncbi:innexin unc-9-like [Pecten maximus]|uniref:innexin unc-9-like n=1 Tax=Pecten maximus TaxID=6579 RepID=UPI0014582A1B|nr:innexin unc-9-like [Pecten maximus]
MKQINLYIFFSLDGILGPLIYAPGSQIAWDDNYIDRISRYYTIMFLLFFNIYVVTEEYVGKPIYCWCPPEFTDNEVKYINDLCWVSNTYYLPFDIQVPAHLQARKDESDEITYYQWVPLVLFLQALMFYLPRLIWKLYATRAGIEVKKMCILAKFSIDVFPEDREQRLRHIASYLDAYAVNTKQFRGGICSSVREKFAKHIRFGCGRHFGNFFITLNILVRFLYFANAFGQLFMMNEFLGNKFYVFGIEVVQAFLAGLDWTMSPRFPRMTLCDVDRRQLQNVNRYTLQCVIPINVYNEKIFLFLWFWFLIISVLSFVNLCGTITIAVLPHYKETFIMKYLKMAKLYDTKLRSSQRKICRRFMKRYLTQDTVFVVKRISDNANTAVTTDVVMYLFYRFLNREKKRTGNDNILKLFPPEPAEKFSDGARGGGQKMGGGGGGGGGGKRKKKR